MINNSKNYNLTLEKYKLAVKNLDINHIMSQYNQVILDETFKYFIESGSLNMKIKLAYNIYSEKLELIQDGAKYGIYQGVMSYSELCEESKLSLIDGLGKIRKGVGARLFFAKINYNNISLKAVSKYNKELLNHQTNDDLSIKAVRDGIISVQDIEPISFINKLSYTNILDYKIPFVDSIEYKAFLKLTKKITKFGRVVGNCDKQVELNFNQIEFEELKQINHFIALIFASSINKEYYSNLKFKLNINKEEKESIIKWIESSIYYFSLFNEEISENLIKVKNNII